MHTSAIVSKSLLENVIIISGTEKMFTHLSCCIRISKDLVVLFLSLLLVLLNRFASVAFPPLQKSESLTYPESSAFLLGSKSRNI